MNEHKIITELCHANKELNIKINSHHIETKKAIELLAKDIEYIKNEIIQIKNLLSSLNIHFQNNNFNNDIFNKIEEKIKTLNK